MRRLEGSLQVVRLVDVFEDERHVFIVQELCRGGELHHRIGARHYSERTVASFMRAVLRTLAQCHSRRILHRDVKPGNFMLLDESDGAPLKAIGARHLWGAGGRWLVLLGLGDRSSGSSNPSSSSSLTHHSPSSSSPPKTTTKRTDFGLAVPFDPEGLPRTDLGFEGTPWFMAPEVLSSQVLPASDVWSAGVMAHQLLTGRLPFDDHRNPFAPSISAVWRSVLCDKVAYNMPWWEGVSDDAKDFVASLLQRDPAKRPTAKEALKHPWLRGDSSERSAGKQIDLSVVQRIQRFASGSHFKRSALRLIAEELLARPGAAAAAVASRGGGASSREGSAHGGAAARGGASSREGSAHGGGSGAAAASGDQQQQQQQPSPAPRGVIPGPDSGALRDLYAKLHFDASDAALSAVDRAAAADAIARMGFRLRPSELAQLVDAMDVSGSGKVRRAAFAASQIDWRHLQQADVAAWLEIARRAFGRLDADADGVISADDIVASLRAKLPEDELAAALEAALAEGGLPAEGAARGLDFDAFLHMLKVGSLDSLDQYDARFEFASPGSLDRLQSLLDASLHGGAASSGDGSSHRGRRPGSRGGGEDGGGSGAPSPAAAGGSDYRDRSWNLPPPNFRFDFGDFGGGGAAAAGAGAGGGSGASSAAPTSGGNGGGGATEHRAWPGLTTGAPVAPPRVGIGAGIGVGVGVGGIGGGNGTVRAGGHFDRRMHGASLYRNMLVGHAPAALETVRE